METVSLFISAGLDSIGYNDEMLKFRRDSNQRRQNILNEAPIRNDFETIIVEDTSKMLLIKRKVFCLSPSDKNLLSGDKQLLFEADRTSSPPGYARLVLSKPVQGYIYDQDVLCSTFGYPVQYLWGGFYSNKMKDDLERNALTKQKTTMVIGPMVHADDEGNFNFPLTLIDNETVEKVKRKLKTQQAIQAVCPADGFVFPDSSSGSDMSHLEWRISYTRTEQRLFQTLNVTQIKLYVLLKMIGKSALSKISADINPYVMKNIVFWMIYLCPTEVFQEKYLVNLLIASLGILYNCVRTGFIPCFMTEERNLLTNPMETPRKHDLLRMLCTLQQERASMLLRIEKLRNVMIMKFKSPHLVDTYQRQRDRLEQHLLILELMQAGHTAKTSDFREYQKDILTAVYDMVLPGWEQLCHEGVKVHDTVIKRIQEIFSSKIPCPRNGDKGLTRI